VSEDHIRKTYFNRSLTGFLENVLFKEEELNKLKEKINKLKSGNIEKTLRGHSSHVFSARFSPNNRRVITAGGETAKLWDVSTGEQVKMLIGHSKIVHSAAFSPDGTVIVTTSEEGTAKLWNAQNGQEIRTIEVDTDWIYDAVFSPNGRTVAIGGQNGLLGLWNVSNGRQIRTFDGHRRAITSVCFSPDGKLLAFNKGWSPVLMVVPSDGGEAREVWRMKEKGEQISTIAWMPDGKELIFASYQLPYREKDEMWKIGIEGGEPQKLGLSMERINWLSVHPAGNQIVFSSIQRIKDVWMMENFLPAEDKGSKGGQK